MNENGTYTLYRTDDHRCSNVIYNANAEHINYSARETTKKCNNQERRCDGILMKQNSENNIKHKQKLPTMSRKRYTRFFFTAGAKTSVNYSMKRIRITHTIIFYLHITRSSIQHIVVLKNMQIFRVVD
ncbi:hypothetical protein SK128_003982 [Halocaridina rubra]|uniref:Uncharacterized protein n=1 Tax=Halocaridina rubra TaxID=373956 RepID=A0AAN8XCM9_HALRR